MRCFVINLREAYLRRRRICAQLDEAGIDYSLFEALDFARNRKRHFRRCDETGFILNAGRPPVTSELGCFASHIMLWRTCRLLDEPLVVLEDDADIAPDFPAALDFVEREIGRLGFVRLEINERRMQYPIVRNGHRCISYCARYPDRSTGYAISPRAANAFIEHSAVIDMPVDVFIKRFWAHGQPLYSLYPSVVRCGVTSRCSTIHGRYPQTLARGLSWRRWWRKRQDLLRRELFNLRWFRAHTGQPLRQALRRLAAAAFRNGS